MAISMEITRAVVDGGFGELKVTFQNGGTAIQNVRVVVRDNGAVTNDATGHLDYLPGEAENGYHLDAVAGNDTVERLFAIKPVDAEAGKIYSAEAVVLWDGGSEAPVATDIFVEARPEVYAAIGAAERVRQMLLESYNDFKDTGRAVHAQTTLPDSEGEPVHDALQPTAFQWVLGMIQHGTRGYKKGGPTSGNPPPGIP